MTNCLGFDIDLAEKVLTSEGFLVYRVEVRSKKGVDGDSYRVIRQKMTDDGTVELCCSCIKTVPQKSEE